MVALPTVKPQSENDMARRIGDSHAALYIRKKCLVRREEFLDYMTFRANARPLFTEIFGPLLGLKEEWAAQGASPEELDLSAYRFRCPEYGRLPVNTDFAHGWPEEILEETEDMLFARDAMGRRVQLAKKASTIPLPLEYPVHNMDDWRRFRHHYEFSDDRLGEGWEAAAGGFLAEGKVITVGIPGAYATLRELMGAEDACLAPYDQPELVEDVLRTMGDTASRVLDTVSARVPVDMLAVHEDMAGISGPLWGPRQVRQYMKPYYRRVWDMLAGRGCRLFMQDSDGNITPILPELLECGLNMIHPCEPAAGMDIVRLREQYGQRLALEGGIDKHVLRRSREEIEAELEYKLPPMVRTGGCVLGLDHRIPNGTPLWAYRFYIQKAWEILERESG